MQNDAAAAPAYCLHDKHPDPRVEARAKAIYLAKYGTIGGIWEANETPQTWWTQAEQAITAEGGDGEARPAVDWYERQDELWPGMVFRTKADGMVKLDRQVPGDATRWYVATWWNSWAYMDDTIEPGDLVERVDDKKP